MTTKSWRGPTIAFVAALALYVASMAPGVWWGDSAEMARNARDLSLSPVARGYPLHALLCFLVGKVVGDPAVGANLVSALCGAAAVALAYDVGRRLGRNERAGAAAAASLAVAHTFWQYAAVAEVYALHVAFMLAAVAIALRLGAGTSRARFALGLVLAVSGMLHHRMTVFLVPGLIWWAWTATPRGERGRAALETAFGVVVGTLPWIALYVANGRSPPPDEPHPWGWRFDDVMLGGAQNASYLLDAGQKSFAKSAVYLAQFVVLNFAGVGLVAVVCGFVVAARRDAGRIAVLLALLVGAHLWFPFRYDWTGDQYTFLVPLYPLFAVAAGIAVGAAADRWGTRAATACVVALGVLPPALYVVLATTPLGAKAMPRLDEENRRGFFLPVRRGAPRPDETCAAKLERLPSGALLHCDWGDGEVYKFLQDARGLRTDVEIRIFYRALREEPGRAQWVSVGRYAAVRPKQLADLAPRLRDEGGGLFRLVE